MDYQFYKYQGTGNDFVMIDNRGLNFPKQDHKLIERLCDRRFGVGADGLILLEDEPQYDFKMVYFNANGREGSMCGNGGRCTVRFALHLGIFQQSTKFLAVDGEHEAFLDNDLINLKMKDVQGIEPIENYYFIDTGSPHTVQFVADLDNFDVSNEGKRVRYSPHFIKDGTNVNFVEILSPNHIQVRTYERGVEAETYSCGTGVTACSLACYSLKDISSPIHIKTLGGNLKVSFKAIDNNTFEDIYLAGAAERVFEGIVR